jgi:formylglycine-generating enzyme required for sulfatase activity
MTDYAWFSDNADYKPHEVGQKQPNPFGLFDILGNVREWVHDFYDVEAYAQSAAKGNSLNPTGPESGKVHVARGGGYRSSAEALRCSARDYEKRWWRAGDPQIPQSRWWLPSMDQVGLRVARSAATAD